MRNSSVEAMQDSFAAQEAACHPRRHRVDDYSAPNRWLHFFRSILPTGNLSLCVPEEHLCDSGIRKGYYVFMTAHLLALVRQVNRALGSATCGPSILFLMPKHSVESRMLYPNSVIA